MPQSVCELNVVQMPYRYWALLNMSAPNRMVQKISEPWMVLSRFSNINLLIPIARTVELILSLIDGTRTEMQCRS